MKRRDRSAYLGLSGLKNPSCRNIDVTFEHKLKVKRIAGTGKPIFTESLILAQDERWRRA